MTQHEFNKYGTQIQCKYCGVDFDSIKSNKPCSYEPKLTAQGHVEKSLSRRDHFAMSAVTGYLAGKSNETLPDIISWSVRIADALIKELDKKQPEWYTQRINDKHSPRY